MVLKRCATFFCLAGTMLAFHACRTSEDAIGHWKVRAVQKDTTGISWVPFKWISDSVGSRNIERLAMFIPVSIPDIPYPLTCQFDLGSDLTVLYGNNIYNLFKGHPQLQPHSISDATVIPDFTLDYGNMEAKTGACIVRTNYGDTLSLPAADKNDTLHIGTIGADMFQDKVLIIDYVRQRFAICDKVPAAYNKRLTDVDLDERGRVVLPMTLKGKKYRISFDNGSSLFPLITSSKNVGVFSSQPDTDSLEISSWGKKHYVTGRMMTDTFELAGKRFANVKVYTNHAGLGMDQKTDGMTGNALFWNSTIVIDFRNKKFGVLD